MGRMPDIEVIGNGKERTVHVKEYLDQNRNVDYRRGLNNVMKENGIPTKFARHWLCTELLD